MHCRCYEITCEDIELPGSNATTTPLTDSLHFFCRLPFSLRHLPASWTSLICWKTRWAPRRGVLASTLPPPLPPPPCSTTPRLPSQAWVAAMAICRSRWGPTCCTPTAAEDCPTSYSQVRLTVGRPCWCPSQATVAAAWQNRKSVFCFVFSTENKFRIIGHYVHVWVVCLVFLSSYNKQKREIHSEF